MVFQYLSVVSKLYQYLLSEFSIKFNTGDGKLTPQSHLTIYSDSPYMVIASTYA